MSNTGNENFTGGPTGNGRKILIWVVAFIFIVAIVIFLWPSGCTNSTLLPASCSRELKVSACDEGVNENNALAMYDLLCEQKNRELEEKADSIRLLLEEKNNSFETVNSTINTLRTQLDECQAKKTIRKPANVLEKKKEVKVEDPTKFKKVETTPNSRTTTSALAGDEYEGYYGPVGDKGQILEAGHGVTISDESYLVYFISEKEANAGQQTIKSLGLPDPMLNGNNPEKTFYWDDQKKLWIFEDRSQLITIDRLLSDKPIIWCAYIGYCVQYDYDCYLPHEIAKTNWDAAKEAAKKGIIQPHENDPGWDYVTKINFKKK